MSNKQQRTAYNLTKLAKMNRVNENSNQFTMMYEIAKDAGIACISGKDYGIDHIVFIPQKDWDKVKDSDETRNYKHLRANQVIHWCKMAEFHQF